MHEDKYLVEKSNTLNNFMVDEQTGTMNLTEYRFFCLYLSKIDPRNKDSATVRIYLKEFEEIYGSKLNITLLTKNMIGNLKRTVRLNTDSNVITYATLYSIFEFNPDNTFITVETNEKLKPYIFELTKSYTKYKLKNIIHLNSVPKIRLYEVLVQYIAIGERTFELDELKSTLGVSYSTFKDFNKYTLTPAIKDINEYTNINVSFDKITKKRVVIAIRFYIQSKTNDIIPTEIANVTTDNSQSPNLSANLTSTQNVTPLETDNTYKYMNPILNKELLKKRAAVLLGTDYQDVPDKITEFINFCINCAEEQPKYQNNAIENVTAYISKIMENQAEKWKATHKPTSYNITDFEKYAVNYENFQKAQNLATETPLLDKQEHISHILGMSYDEALIYLNNIDKDWAETWSNADFIKNILNNKLNCSPETFVKTNTTQPTNTLSSLQDLNIPDNLKTKLQMFGLNTKEDFQTFIADIGYQTASKRLGSDNILMLMDLLEL